MNKKLDYVDALRGIAILGVLLVHTKGQFGSFGIFDKVAGLGAKGVQLFYFISAFTLFLSYNNRKNDENFPGSNFFIRRFFRIAPLYYFAIIYYTVKLLLFDGVIVSFKEILFNFTFTHGFSPIFINHLVPGGWSIAVEMSFYIMVPFLMSKINNINKAVVFLLISLFIRFIFAEYFKLNPVDSNVKINNDYLYWYLPNQLPCFAIGILFYFILEDVKLEIKNTMVIGLLVLLGSILCIVDQLFIGLNFFSWDFLFSLGFFVLAIGLSNNKIPFLVNKFSIVCGKYSYSMYIIHFIVLFWIDELGINFYFIHNSTIFHFVVYYLIVIAITTLLSMITYKVIEVPTQLLGKKIINKREGRFLLVK